MLGNSVSESFIANETVSYILFTVYYYLLLCIITFAITIITIFIIL